MKVNINNGYLEYEITGNGIPLLFIHGYPLSHKIWEPQVNNLADVATVITIDLRGHGESYPFDGSYAMEILAEDCLRVMDQIRIKTTFLVCGLSMGGYIALAMYRKYPGKFAGMILTATRSGPDTSEARTSRDMAIKTAYEHGADRIASNMIRKIVSQKTHTTKPDLIKQIFTIMAKTSTNGMIGALQGMKDRPDSTPMLSKIRCPVLIIHGEDDQLIPVHEAQAMHMSIPNSKLILVPDAGHLPNLEQPQHFNQAIRDFLKIVN